VDALLADDLLFRKPLHPLSIRHETQGLQMPRKRPPESTGRTRFPQETTRLGDGLDV